MTSLIDVIFLLLRFFMLTSTFSKFSEVELTAGGSGANVTTPAHPPVFVQLSVENVLLNGNAVSLEKLAEGLSALVQADEPEEVTSRSVLVSLRGQVTAQRLTDLLVVLRRAPNVSVTVLGTS